MRRRGGQDGTEVAPYRCHPARMHDRHVVVERVDHNAEGHVALVLCGTCREHEHAFVARRVADHAQQRALADPGLPEHSESAA